MAGVSGVGCKPNQTYSKSNHEFRQSHTYEDIPFFKILEDTKSTHPAYVCGILDGHNGDEVVRCVFDRLMRELTSIWLSNMSMEEEVSAFLARILINIDHTCLQTLQREIDGLKTAQGGSESDCTDDGCMEVIDRLERLERKKACGCVLVIALVFRGKLYVANIGDCHAVLCHRDPESGQLVASSLTREHSLDSEPELERLRRCGLSANSLREMSNRGKYNHTRCVGDYRAKKDYAHFSYLRYAHSAPVIGDPEVSEGLAMDPSWCHLVLLSSGMGRLLHELVYERDKVDGEVSHLVEKEMERNAHADPPQLVAQRVVDYVAEQYNTGVQNLLSIAGAVDCPSGFEDLTLLIHCFPHPPAPPQERSQRENSPPLSPPSPLRLSPTEPDPPDTEVGDPLPSISVSQSQEAPTEVTVQSERSRSRTLSDSSSSPDTTPFPYLEFSDWYGAMALLSTNEQGELDKLVSGWPPMVESIKEEEWEGFPSRPDSFSTNQSARSRTGQQPPLWVSSGQLPTTPEENPTDGNGLTPKFYEPEDSDSSRVEDNSNRGRPQQPEVKPDVKETAVEPESGKETETDSASGSNEVGAVLDSCSQKRLQIINSDI